MPDGLLDPVAGGDYAEPLRPILLDFKERGCLSHAGPLGEVLAAAVLLLASAGARVTLVPVPSARTARRRRGFDHMLILARASAAALRRGGQPARVVPVLSPRGRAPDQGGLDQEQRGRNAQGRFSAAPAALRLVRGEPVVVVDDILTTGNTLREAQQVLAASGVTPAGGAVVAATRLLVVPRVCRAPGR